jgi:hypothetical protein
MKKITLIVVCTFLFAITGCSKNDGHIDDGGIESTDSTSETTEIISYAELGKEAVERRILIFPSDELKSCLKRGSASLYQLNDKSSALEMTRW